MVFIQDRTNLVYSESQARARVATIFFSNIIVGILAQISVQPVMTRIRDSFYQHHSSGMHDSLNLFVALGFAETGWIIVSSAMFCLVFITTSGFAFGYLLGYLGILRFRFRTFFLLRPVACDTGEV